jgi:hypothetical protein
MLGNTIYDLKENQSLFESWEVSDKKSEGS